ncbi:hypothetical protein IAD21_04283 [Abditibacteriota bacterium]|nr:hypothetical protein IAD21_04283 [Abditibacteriota bacterium]
MNPLFITLLQAVKKLLRIIWLIFLLPFACLRLVLGLILMALAHRYRPLWRKYLRVAMKLRLKHVGEFPPLLLLAWDEKEKWSQVVPLLQTLDSETQRMKVAGSFATLYLWDERLTEAREATSYWIQISSAWVEEHPVESTQAARIYQKSTLWYPHGIPFIEPNDVSEQVSLSFSYMKSEAKLLAAAAAIDKGIVMEWRDARLVSEFVDWATGKQLIEGVIWEQSPLPLQRESSMAPTGYDSVHFARFFVACAGISQSEFKRMWRRANSLDDIPHAAHSELG